MGGVQPWGDEVVILIEGKIISIQLENRLIVLLAALRGKVISQSSLMTSGVPALQARRNASELTRSHKLTVHPSPKQSLSLGDTYAEHHQGRIHTP